MKTYVQRMHSIDLWESTDHLSDSGLLSLAKYLYEEGFIKVSTEWDEEKKCNVTRYSIEAIIKEELKTETKNNESSEDTVKKQKGFFERLFETFRNNN